MSAGLRARIAESATRIGLVVATVAVGCAPRSAYPDCANAPPAADVEAAKDAHNAATRFFEKQDYGRAVELWLAAYELDCTAHPLLINIARAYENAGNEAAAEEAYALYVARAGATADPEIVARVKGPTQKGAANTAPPATPAAAVPTSEPSEP